MKLENGEYLGKNSQTFYADGLIISKTVYREKVFEGWHYHQNNHLSFILNGGNREYRHHTDKIILPGNIVLYHSGEWHRNCHTQHPSHNINLEIEDRFLQQYEACFNRSHIAFKPLHTLQELTSGITAISQRNRLTQTNAWLTAIRIYHDCKAGDIHTATSVHLQLLSLLQAATGKPKEEKYLFGGNTEKIIELLHDRWNESVSLQELSSVSGLHPVTVSRHFAAYFDCSLGEYMRRIRIQKALFLVRQPDISLTDIAYRCGFFDQSHFIRAFKTQTGFLPGAFRKL
ncbi:helix-turn-helix transcriptional regulator [Chitinophaga rhizophila]|uniref:AraC family transcriptional regulator n=1 Tax=Chitinophaga rhizophila TaxID=2866212 RepID=A0ABS7G9E6_9BACT|nr:AraC family transcriptional regulator [Chitinophaga rhizophila]MBW8683925.1 AraC family transcriptional regulator [Chitinophaga rhizophila]